MSDSGASLVDQRPWYTDALPRFQTASGAIVEINAPGYDLTQPWFHSFHLKVEPPYTSSTPVLRNRAFQVSQVGILEQHAKRSLKGRVVEEVSAMGGRVVIARNAEELGIAAWRGRWHEVYIWLNEPGTTMRQVLDSYDRLRFVDSPLGVRVLTGSAPRETVYREEVGKHVPGVGHLTVLSAEDAVGLLPKWSGAKVRSGEVWRKDVPTDQGGNRTVFVHANTSAVSTLDEERFGDPDAKRLQFLDALHSLTWTTS